MQAESILPHHSSVYSIVTEQILKQLESGVAPWHRAVAYRATCNLAQGSNIAASMSFSWRRKATVRATG